MAAVGGATNETRHDGTGNLIPGARDRKLPAPSSQPVDQIRELFAKQLYALCLDPPVMRRFRKLLGSKNEKTALEAWRLAFEHGWPVDRAPQQARTLVQINNKVGRPPKVVVEGAVIEG